MSVYEISLTVSLFKNLGIDYISCSVFGRSNERYMFTTDHAWGQFVLENWGINAYPLRERIFDSKEEFIDWDQVELNEDESYFLKKRREICKLAKDCTVILCHPHGFDAFTFGSANQDSDLRSFYENHKNKLINFAKMLRNEEVTKELNSLSVPQTQSILYNAIPLEVKTAEDTLPQSPYLIKSKVPNKE